nr:sensor histidine kinase [Anaerolineae bacterium]
DDLMLMLELEQAEITPRPLSLNTLAGHVIEHIGKKAEDKQLTLMVSEPNGEVTSHGEEGYLNRALLMLVDNAIEFTPEGGSVTLTVGKDEHYAVLSVTDTGVGIPAEELSNIFDHMYKVDKARNTERGGLGLGLSIVRRITALHHGEITVESEPDKGSTFTIKIPHPSDTPPNKPATVSTMTPEIRALLVRATDEIDRADS